MITWLKLYQNIINHVSPSLTSYKTLEYCKHKRKKCKNLLYKIEKNKLLRNMTKTWKKHGQKPIRSM